MKSSTHYSVYGWLFLGLATVAVLLDAGEGVKAGAFVASMVSFLGADLARQFGK